MKSYKNWQLVNESYLSGLTLGLSNQQSLGLQSNTPGFSLSEKKKINGDVIVDLDEPNEEECSCKKNKKTKKMHKDDECSCKDKKKEVKFSKKMKKKMKNMKDDFEDDDMEKDDEINDLKKINSSEDDDMDDDDMDDDDMDDMDDDDMDDDDMDDDDMDDDDMDDDDMDDDDMDDDDMDDDEGDDAPKFGFMKDKKRCKKMKNKMKQENAFWEDIKSNYKAPKNYMGTDEEFFTSLARQYGNPNARFNSGIDKVNEDLLLSPEQQALINAMPKPGETGFAPTQRLGGNFDYYDPSETDSIGYGETIEESADFEVLCKYFNEDVAYEIISKKLRKS